MEFLRPAESGLVVGDSAARRWLCAAAQELGGYVGLSARRTSGSALCTNAHATPCNQFASFGRLTQERGGCTVLRRDQMSPRFCNMAFGFEYDTAALD
jgi:hypothetical protein